MDWDKIKAEYIAGGTSYRKLAEKYGIPFSNLKRIAIKEQWAQMREQVQARTNTKLMENISRQNAKIDDKYYRIIDKLFDKAEEIVDSTPVWQAYSLKEMATAMKCLKECRGIKSDKDAEEQAARIKALEARVKADEADEEGTGVVQLPAVMTPPVEDSDG